MPEGLSGKPEAIKSKPEVLSGKPEAVKSKPEGVWGKPEIIKRRLKINAETRFIKLNGVVWFIPLLINKIQVFS